MRQIDRKILALAVPALGALVAEPLFIALDTAMVGHLGAAQLAGLAIASTIMQTLVGLMVFLAYATTPIVARRLGARDRSGAVQAGVDGIYLAAGLGAALAVLLAVAHPVVIGFYHLDAHTAQAANTYLIISIFGLPAMLLVFAATGVLRGLQDTRTPLAIAGAGFTANAVLNAVLIYGCNLGIAGSALGTVIAQWGMVAVYIVVIQLKYHPSWRLGSVRELSVSGGWLFVRTLTLRASLLITVGAASAHGTDTTAAYQIVFTILSTLAFALDALAIAAQALIGHAFGSQRRLWAASVIRRTLSLGMWATVPLGALLLVSAPVVGRVFTTEPAVLEALPWAVAVLAISLPIAAVVYVLDGVLMGAGEARYLALAGVVVLAAYTPAIVWVWISDLSAPVVLLTVMYSFVFMGARFVTLTLRTRRITRVTPVG